jgi:2',3'-cyclic-nucleotide 2'-phosphodiesterase (5'-nucleotidase family)
MGLGNHDFDDSIAGITPFAEQVNYDLLGSNLVVNTDNFIEGVHFNRSLVKVINGTQVGIIGYVTQKTERQNFPE